MDRIYVMELVRSFQVGLIDRRTFLARATKALGSAAAAGMLLTACQHSEEETPPPVVDESANGSGAEPATAGLVTGTVSYPGDQEGETLSGYLARPEEEGTRLGVVVIQEWWGLDDHIKDVTRRFASVGFAALAPDLYHGQVTTEPDQARKLVMELDMEAAVAEIRAAMGYLLGQDYVEGEAAGAVGFCMGGGLVLQLARVSDRLGAAVAFYGSPLSAEQAAQVEAPVMGNYGAEDQGIPESRIRTMEAAFEEAGVNHDIKIYEGAQHAFFNDTRPSSHAPEASEDAWARTLDWFRTHLPG